MARLRFPGRPGFRFDRLGVRYGVDGHQRGLDPSTKLIDNVHRGLRYFRQLFGESDEEDFEGFTEREIRTSEKNLTALLGPLASPPRKSRQLRSDDIVSSDTAHNDEEEEAERPATRPTRGRTVSLKELQKKLFKRGITSPMKTSVGAKVRLLEQKRKEKERIRLQKQKEKAAAELKLRPIKIRLGSDGNQAKIVRGPGRPSIYDKKEVGGKSTPEQEERGNDADGEGESDADFEGAPEPVGRRVTRHGRQKKVVVVPASKRKDKSVARQLLNKAKRGMPRRGRKPEEVEDSVIDNASPPKEKSPDKPPQPVPSPIMMSPPKPKVFILPAVSSRSSRKITPNRRFIEESSQDYFKKVRSPSVEQTPPGPPKSQRRRSSVSESEKTTSTKRAQPILAPPKLVPPPAPVVKQKTPTRTTPPEVATAATAAATGSKTPEKAVPEPKTQTSPLIVEGKRERKPSMKLIQKLTDDDALVLMNRKLENRKKIEEKKKGHTDVSTTPESPMKMTPSNIEQLRAAGFSEAEIVAHVEDKTELLTLEQLERTAEATKRSGQNILRKAKLQLNRAALNRSKAALARSLKREMKKEQKLAEQKATEQQSVKTVGFGGFRTQTMLQQSPLKLGGFGQQGLPTSQVPKFSMEPSCLPTSPLLGAGLPGTSTSGSPPGDTFLFPKEPAAEGAPSKSDATPSAAEATPSQTDATLTQPMLGSPRSETAASKSPKSDAKPKEGERSTPKKHDVCAVCTVVLEDLRNRGQTTKYYGVSCCAPCQWFYRRRLTQQLQENIEFTCPKEGKCNIFMEKKMCRGCRFRRCKEVLPDPSELNFVQQEIRKMDDQTLISRKHIFSEASGTESELDMSATDIDVEGTLRTPPRIPGVRKEKGEKLPSGEKGSKKKKERKLKKEKGEGEGRKEKSKTEKSEKKKKDKAERAEKKLKKKKSLEADGKPPKKSAKKSLETVSVLGGGIVPKDGADSQEPTTSGDLGASVATAASLSATEHSYSGPSAVPGPSTAVPDDTVLDDDDFDEELEAIMNAGRDSNLDFMFQAPLPVDPPQPSTSSQPTTSEAPFTLESTDDSLLLPSTSSVTDPSPYSGSDYEEDSDSDYSERSYEQRGPRIKHVSRQVSVALGRTATFPARPEIRLSALSQQAKQRLWKRDEQKRPKTPDSDDMSIEEIIRRARDHVDNVVHVKDRLVETQKLKALTYRGSPGGRMRRVYHDDDYDYDEDEDDEGAFQPRKPYQKRTYSKSTFLTKSGVGRKRKVRCNQCANCKSTDCQKCASCKDMKRYGGRGVMKQACENRRCLNPIGPDIALKYPRKLGDEGGEDPGGGVMRGRGGRRPYTKRHPKFFSSMPREQYQRDDAWGMEGGLTSAMGAGGLKYEAGSGDQRRSPVAARRGKDGAGVHVPPLNATGGQHQRALKKMDKNKVMAQEFGDSVVLQSLVPASQRWIGGRDNYTLKVDLRGELDVETAWRHGVSLVSSAPMCVRTVCFLCGSAGKEELIYCNVCCEPFHSFCLEDRERPRIENLENWCCRRCQFCHVCGKQHNLLCCDKCQNTYHPECLGPNYPAKPSRHKNIWVCMKCVKCRSCGATTPGTQVNACWTHDFTLCYGCGHLTDQGNYCPLCKKCYADDDWDCKMIQCSSCESWVHAKCEGLTDEMYQVLSYLPDEVAYNCRVCLPVHPAPWEQTIRREIHAGIAAVIGTMVVSKSITHLQTLEDEEVPKVPAIGGGRKTPSPPTVGDSAPGQEKPLPMEELDPDVLAAAESLLQQVCEAEEEEAAKTESTQGTTTEAAANDNVVEPCAEACGPTSSQVTSSCASKPANCEKTDSVGEMDTKDVPPSREGGEGSAGMLCGEDDAMQNRSLNCDNTGETSNMDATPTLTKCCDARTASQVPGSVNSGTGGQVGGGSVAVDSITGSADNKDSTGNSIAVQLNTERTEINSVNDSDSPMDVDPSGVKEYTQTHKSGQIDPILDVIMRSLKSELPKGGSLLKGDNPRPSAQRRVVHFEDEKLDLEVAESLSAAAVSDGTQSIEERSPSATLTADEVAQDTLSDFGDLEVIGVPDYISLSAFMPVKPAKKLPTHPRDLIEVKKKVVDKNYRTVEEFNDDIVRIIQFNVKRIAEATAPQYRRKAMKTVQSLFVKTMKECFPWFSVANSRLWDHNRRLPDGMLEDATVPPNDDHTYAQWMEKEQGIMSPQPSPFKKMNPSSIRKIRIPMASLDNIEGGRESPLTPTQQEEDGDDMRRCVLCAMVGDQDTEEAGRLIYVNQDEWVHINCALWSAEVFEEDNHSLQNVHTALNRGRQMKCDYCSLPGATVGCCCRGCSSNYHFMCARKQRCIFQEDKKVFCRNHWDMMDSELVDNNRFGIVRRSCVNMKDMKWTRKAWVRGVNPNAVNVLCGSMTVESLGRLAPFSDTRAALIPVDFCSTRVFWSTVDARRRCVYTCRIILVKPAEMSAPQAIVKDMTVIHDMSHPEYDPAKLTELAEMIERQRPPPKKRKRRLSTLSGTGSSDSEDSDYAPSDEDDDDKVMPAWRTVGKPVGRPAGRPLGIKQASHTVSLPESLPRATCGNEIRAPTKKAPLQDVMTPLPKGNRTNETLLPSVVKPAEKLTTETKQMAPETKQTAPLQRVQTPPVANMGSSVEPKPVLGLGVAKKPKTTLSDETLERLGQELGVTDNEDDDLEAVSGNTENGTGGDQTAEASFFMKTVNTSKTVRRRRHSHDSTASESDGTVMTGSQEPKPLKELFTEKQATTLGQKIDAIVGYLGVSPQQGAPALQTQLEELHGHISTNNTDHATSERVVNLLKSVPNLLNEQTTGNHSSEEDRKSKLGFISSEIGNIIGIVTNSPKKTGQGVVNNTVRNQTMLSQGTLDESGLRQPSGGEGGSFQSASGSLPPPGVENGTVEEDSHRPGLTPEELAAAEAAMIKAQVDGKHDSDEDVSEGGSEDSKATDNALKSYPLRRTAARAAEVSVQQQKLQMAGTRRSSDAGHRSEDMQLADKIALRIKTESLARSAPSVDGPFKCSNCKRVYRTQESYCRHIKDCDYYVSSEEDEEEEEVGVKKRADNEWSPNKKTGAQPSLMRLRDNAARRSVRGQNMAAAAAIESPPAQGKMIIPEKTVLIGEKNVVLPERTVTIPEKRGRGRPRKYPRPPTPEKQSPRPVPISQNESPLLPSPEKEPSSSPPPQTRALRSTGSSPEVQPVPIKFLTQRRISTPQATVSMVSTRRNSDPRVVPVQVVKMAPGIDNKEPVVILESLTRSGLARKSESEPVQVNNRGQVRRLSEVNSDLSQHPSEDVVPSRISEPSTSQNSSTQPSPSVDNTTRNDSGLVNVTTGVVDTPLTRGRGGVVVRTVLSDQLSTESRESESSCEKQTIQHPNHSKSVDKAESPQIALTEVNTEQLSEQTTIVTAKPTTSQTNNVPKKDGRTEITINFGASSQAGGTWKWTSDQKASTSETVPEALSRVLSPTAAVKFLPAPQKVMVSSSPANNTNAITMPPKVVTVNNVMNSTPSRPPSASPPPTQTHFKIIKASPSPTKPGAPTQQFRVISQQSNSASSPSPAHIVMSPSGPRILLPSTTKVLAMKKDSVKPVVTQKKETPTNVIDLNELMNQGYFASWKEESMGAEEEEEEGVTVTVNQARPTVAASTTVGTASANTITAQTRIITTATTQPAQPVPLGATSIAKPRVNVQTVVMTRPSSASPVNTIAPINVRTVPVTTGDGIHAKDASPVQRPPAKSPVVIKVIRNKPGDAPGVTVVATSPPLSYNTKGVRPNILMPRGVPRSSSGSTTPTTISTGSAVQTIKTLLKQSNEASRVPTPQQVSVVQQQPGIITRPSLSQRTVTTSGSTILQDVFRKPIITSSVVKAQHHQQQQQFSIRSPGVPAVRNIHIQDITNSGNTNNLYHQQNMAANCQNVLLPNNQIITVVSSDMMQRPLQASPLTVVSNAGLINQGVNLMAANSGIISQSALVQAGLIPNTAYIQQPSVQPVQLQTINMLNTPSGLCLQPRVSYVTSTPNFVQPQTQQLQQQAIQQQQLQQQQLQQQQLLQQQQQQLLQQQQQKQQAQQAHLSQQQSVQQQLQQQKQQQQQQQQQQLQQQKQQQQQHQPQQPRHQPQALKQPPQATPYQHLQPNQQQQAQQQKIQEHPKLPPRQISVQQRFTTPNLTTITSVLPTISPEKATTSQHAVTRPVQVRTPTPAPSTPTPPNTQLVSLAQTQSLLSSMFKAPLPDMRSPTRAGPSNQTKSDQIILEELTGRKMNITGDALDSAATSILSMLIKDKVVSTANNNSQHPLRSILATKSENAVTSVTSSSLISPRPVSTHQEAITNMAMIPRAMGSHGTPTVHIERSKDGSNPIIRLETTTEEECYRDGPTDQDKKVRFKKIIRKKIVIRKAAGGVGGLMKRKLSESPSGAPYPKKHCLLVDKNGVVHGTYNNLPSAGGSLTPSLPQRPMQIQQVMKVPPHPMALSSLHHSTLKEKRKPKFKLPPRKYTRLQPKWKMNPKLLKAGYSKENLQESMDELLQRKKARKQALQARKDMEAHGTGPVIHPHLQHPMLPQPEMEEEVVSVPAMCTDDDEPRRQKQKKDGPHLVYEITSDDGFHVRCDTSHEAWKTVTDRVQDARANARLKQLSYSGVNGLAMFGLVQNAVTYLLEQLYGAQHCTHYRFRYHDYRNFDDEPVVESASGTARCEPFHTRKHRDMFSFLLSKYRPLPRPDTIQRDVDLALKSQRRATSMGLPMAMRFRHLRLHAKEAIGVYRSPIHGRGLFCKRDIDAGEMIVEYAGEVIRSIVTDKREKYYESKGIGCYMFRIDDAEVVDATVQGNVARFINHCCEPNCYSRVINIDNKKHIVIFALISIKKGEELTYDYKFPIEDVKIPCTCNAKRCRKYLN